MTNQELKQYMKKRKIYQWRVAERLGIQETALSRKFRHEIGERDKKNIIAVIDDYSSSPSASSSDFLGRGLGSTLGRTPHSTSIFVMPVWVMTTPSASIRGFFS